ncbi:DUF460 domain-containing protein [Desulfurococcus mucosus]|uniref:DUF460 domain-containing protein n=1 Tax=Desulfurococcus mucosus (strain ATCC 35584 / DSM 2162 / JCM 9187 / O7/1) TaxID=765177 RepID=E8R7L8_DESM0|nr:DUF460 domain-containing protein [Desulfurococcus mucosus]ADV64513.1 protein of unknown function DUF460 [Desulfurococcus mucosus DSM 2162]
MGVDIQPGSSPNSRRQPLYSVVILRGGELVASFEDIELHRLLRLVLEYHVDTIAVDNIYELAPSENALRKILELLPSGVRVVQTTGLPGGSRSIGDIARELGMDPRVQTPLKTAYINALAAYKGIGQEVKVFAEKTRIVITKGRSVSQGGMSRDRFLRGIRASIVQATKEVKRVLDENGFDYDMVIKRSKGGLEKSVFIVYAPRDSLHGLVKQFRYKNVRIMIKPYRSRRLLEVGEEKTRIPVIVGVDPGMGIGVAVLTLDGVPLLVTSMKSPDRDDVVAAVSELGRPIIVATDVSRPPETVVKLAAMLNAVLYAPDQDMSVDDKNRIAREYMDRYSVDIPDAHARDALAAAVKAYNKYRNTIEEAKSKLAGIRDVDRYQLIAEVLRGRPLSEVLEEYFKRNIPRRQPIVEEKPTTQQGCGKLREKVSALEALVRRLIEDVEKRDSYIRDLELELRLMRSRKPGVEEYERKISSLIEEIEALRRRIDDKDAVIRELYGKLLTLEGNIVKLGRGELIMLPRAGSQAVRQGSISRGVYMDKVLEIPAELREALTNVRGFIASPIVEVDPLKERIPVVKPETVVEIGDYVLVDKGVVEKAEELWRRINELVELEKHERILRMIEDYQRSRLKKQTPNTG